MAQREIKFRIWDKMLGEMFDWQTVKKTSFEHYEKTEIETEPTLIFEQYTEMYDEEDESIYDGDVIKVWDNGIGVVFYENGMFKVDFKDGRKIELELWWKNFISEAAPDNPFKVLGNIHENPELLEAEQ